MTAPTVEQLRVEQPADPTFAINRDRLRSLRSVDQHRVRRNEAGLDVLTQSDSSTGFGSRVKAKELWQAGLVVLAVDNFYQLTDVGRRRVAQTTAEHDAMRPGGPPTTRPRGSATADR